MSQLQLGGEMELLQRSYCN